MELSWMKTFVTVAELGNFRKASEALYVSQPTVTVHIKALEKELGVTLFERGKRLVKLTEEGRVYLPHAKEVLDLHQQGLTQIQSFTQGYRLQLKLAISPLVADTIMPFVLKNYLENHPEVEVAVEIMESQIIEKAVMDEVVDIGFTLIEYRGSQLNQTKLYEDEVVLCVPHDGLDNETAPALLPEDLLEQYYLLTHNHPVYWESLAHQIKSHYPKTKMMKVSQNHITKRFIVSGLGVSFLPKSTIRREILEGRILQVGFPEIELPRVNTYALTKYHHSLEKDFIDFVSGYQFQ
ncbi:LysR family transcriptional regulator [Filobacillus milosensis]|uniref:LysR family transcriptional regulator n=1 Tax=Filobacillus milosensis TaxID=94137 RepID=A0A4Y8IFR8_9BACI|nr:LysR family transcriptional regulator [Filobacillus milosensis]TFB19503.1 LysR family transcriptional regulator [Filobacillus milosensis]